LYLRCMDCMFASQVFSIRIRCSKPVDSFLLLAGFVSRTIYPFCANWKMNESLMFDTLRNVHVGGDREKSIKPFLDHSRYPGEFIISSRLVCGDQSSPRPSAGNGYLRYCPSRSSESCSVDDTPPLELARREFTRLGPCFHLLRTEGTYALAVRQRSDGNNTIWCSP